MKTPVRIEDDLALSHVVGQLEQLDGSAWRSEVSRLVRARARAVLRQ